MDEIPIKNARVCFKFEIGPHFFHEHGVFTSVDEAADTAQIMIARMANAQRAVMDGSMPDADTVAMIEKLGQFPDDGVAIEDTPKGED